MSLKKIFITVGGLLLVIGITLSVLLLIKPLQKTSQTDTKTSQEAITFKAIDEKSFVPSLDVGPSLDEGWVKQTGSIASSDTVKFTKDECSIDITSQKSPFDTKNKDYALSKALATSIAAGDQGTLYDDSVVSLRSSQGDVEFYSALYAPTVRYTAKGDMETLTEPYVTSIAVRSIGIALPSTSSATEATETKEGTIPLSSSIPSFVVKYTCKKDSFSTDAAADILKKISITFSAPATPSTATPGSTR